MEKDNNIIENAGFIIAIILLVLSISTYIKPILNGGFDFGMIVEVLSLVLVIDAKKYISKNNLNDSMVSAKAAALLIAILFIYDIVQLVENVKNISSEVLTFIWEEWIFIVYIVILWIISLRISRKIDLEKENNDRNR